MNTIVEKQYIIKPVIKQRFSGQSSWNRAKASFEGAQLGKSGYKTGLTEKEEREYEKLLGLVEGTLNKHSIYWATILNLSLPRDKAYYFNVGSPMDELKFKVLQQRDDVATSEIELAKKPQALFYIVDDEAKAKVNEVKMNKEFEAMEFLMESTADEKRSYAKLFGRKGVNDLSDKVVKTYLYEKIKESPDLFLTMTKNNPDLETKVLIAEMLEEGILTKKGSFYNYQGEVLGNSLDSVISFLKDAKNQSVVISSKDILKSKKKTK